MVSFFFDVREGWIQERSNVKGCLVSTVLSTIGWDVGKRVRLEVEIEDAG